MGTFPVWQVYGSSSFIGFLVQCGLRFYIIAYIGNVHADLIVTILQYAERDGIIKIFGVYGIDGEGECFTYILAVVYFRLRDDIWYTGCFFQCIIRKGQWKPILA